MIAAERVLKHTVILARYDLRSTHLLLRGWRGWRIRQAIHARQLPRPACAPEVDVDGCGPRAVWRLDGAHRRFDVVPSPCGKPVGACRRSSRAVVGEPIG